MSNWIFPTLSVLEGCTTLFLWNNVKWTLEKSEGAIYIEQSRDTGNIGYTRQIQTQQNTLHRPLQRRTTWGWAQLQYNLCILTWFDLLCLTPLSAILQLYHGDQLLWWKKPEYPDTTTDHGQATGKLYRMQPFCNLQRRAQTHAVFVICLYELLGNPTT